jgi:hypothetical protein
MDSSESALLPERAEIMVFLSGCDPTSEVAAMVKGAGEQSLGFDRGRKLILRVIRLKPNR